METKAKIQIVGQRAIGDEYGVGLERTTEHVFYAKTDLQIFDAVFACGAASVSSSQPRLHSCDRLRWRDSDRATCARTIPVPEDVDQSERLVGLVHATNRLRDFYITKLLPLAFGNGHDRRLHRRILIRADRKDCVGFLTIIEDRCLIHRAVGAHGRGLADTATPASILEAGEFIRAIKTRQGHGLTCPGEIALA